MKRALALLILASVGQAEAQVPVFNPIKPASVTAISPSRAVPSTAVVTPSTSVRVQAPAGTYLCPNCGQYHPTDTRVQVETPSVPSTGGDCLDLVNRQRAARGKGPLRRNAEFTRGAIIKARTAARFGRKGHIGGSFYGANKEGVGWSTNYSANACYLYTAPAGTPAGAGIARGRDGYYTCLLIDYPGRLSSGGGASRVFRIFRRRG